jgi:pSer/pThr/pTyr-binding forkhead associated (FHA) protein
LLGDKPLSTKSIGSASEEEKAQMGIDSSVLTDVKVQGVSAFSIDDTLQLEIEGSPEPIIFKPKPETIFGRRDPATGAMPDVDLTPFAGYRMGVSRRHAAIRQGEEQSLNIWDLGSSNGTYLNGQKLSAHRPYRLHDGDELRLGQMMIRIRFQIGSEGITKPEQVSDMIRDTREAKTQAFRASAEEKPPITSDIKDAASNVAPPAASPRG